MESPSGILAKQLYQVYSPARADVSANPARPAFRFEFRQPPGEIQNNSKKSPFLISRQRPGRLAALFRISVFAAQKFIPLAALVLEIPARPFYPEIGPFLLLSGNS